MHTYDLGVVLHGLQSGALSMDQAYALFREAKEFAQPFFSHRLRAILDQRQHLVSSSNPLDSPTGRVLELCWKLFERSYCLVLFSNNYRHPLVERFLDDKLRHALDQFSERDLTQLENAYRNGSLHQSVLDARAKKLVPVADLLLRNPAEINKDITEIKKRVSEYRFTAELNEVLDKVEDGLAAGGDPFDQAALLKHLRTFFEKLHNQVGEKLRAAKPETVDGTNLQSCGQALDYLCRQGVLTEKMRDFGRALYGVLSNEGVHALKSEREYVRLCRNVVGEYALVLFFELEQRLQA